VKTIGEDHRVRTNHIAPFGWTDRTADRGPFPLS
jgi:hypothetical protein